MAIKEVLVDDLDETIIKDGKGGTVSFAFDNQHYEIELSNANKEKLAELLAPYIEKARKVGGRKSPLVRAVDNSGEERSYELIDARRWLIEQGHDVSRRGPLPEEFLKLYEEAHGIES